MPHNYQTNHRSKALEKIKIRQEQRVHTNSHDREQCFVERFTHLAETVLWGTLTQRKNELEREKYKVNVTKHFSEDSGLVPFVKMELSPTPAFGTDDARHEAKSVPVYAWCAQPNVRAELIEILQCSQMVSSSACSVLKAFRQWWYTDTISADHLTTEYVESSIDNWVINSIRHCERSELLRSQLDRFNFMWNINSKKDYLLPIIMLCIYSLIMFLIFKSGRDWAFYSFLFILSMPIFVWSLINEPNVRMELKSIYYRSIYDRILAMMFVSVLVSAIAATTLTSPYAQISAVSSMLLGISLGARSYVKSFWENDVAWRIWKILVFSGSVALIPWSRALGAPQFNEEQRCPQNLLLLHGI